MSTTSHRVIESNVKALRARWMRVRFAAALVQSCFYLLITAAVLRLVFPSLHLGGLAGLVLGAAALAGLVMALIGLPSRAALAKDFDDAADLKDQLSSTIELMRAPQTQGPMVAALIEKAAQDSGRIAPASVYPYRVPREGRWLAVPVLMLAAVILFPRFGRSDPGPDPEVARTIEQRIEDLEELLSKERNKELTKERKEILEELEQLKATLSREKLDKKDAMAEIAKMLEQLEKEREREEAKKLELHKMLAGLEEKDEKLEEMIQKGDYQDALNQLKKTLDELEQKQKEVEPEELAKLEEQLREMREVQAQLLKMLQIDGNLDWSGELIDFLTDFEGDLADVEDFDFGGFLKPCDCENPLACQSSGEP